MRKEFTQECYRTYRSQTRKLKKMRGGRPVARDTLEASIQREWTASTGARAGREYRDTVADETEEEIIITREWRAKGEKYANVFDDDQAKDDAMAICMRVAKVSVEWAKALNEEKVEALLKPYSSSPQYKAIFTRLHRADKRTRGRKSTEAEIVERVAHDFLTWAWTSRGLQITADTMVQAHRHGGSFLKAKAAVDEANETIHADGDQLEAFKTKVNDGVVHSAEQMFLAHIANMPAEASTEAAPKTPENTEEEEEDSDEATTPKRPCPTDESDNTPKRRCRRAAPTATPKRTITTRSGRNTANKRQRTGDN
jgi:hypothetical protein